MPMQAYTGGEGTAATGHWKGLGGQNHAPAALPPEKDPVSTVQEAVLTPEAVRKAWKISHRDRRTVQPAANRYTDCAIPVPLPHSYPAKYRVIKKSLCT